MDSFFVVTEPVADIRREPIDANNLYIHDDLQETQVLFNEVLLYKDEIDEWFYVEAVEQKSFRKKTRWQGYPGWIRKNQVIALEKISSCESVIIKKRNTSILSAPTDDSPIILNILLGTRLWFTGNEYSHKDIIYDEVLFQNNKKGWVRDDDVNKTKNLQDEDRVREEIIDTARLFIGIPYLWGGRSIEYGVDCSGLINLVFRVNNIDMPRDSHEQWMVSKRISPEDLKPGDLIFMSEESRYNVINHVMLYAGGENLIEAYETGSTVREISLKDRFGLSIKELKGNELIKNKRQIYFCRPRSFK